MGRYFPRTPLQIPVQGAGGECQVIRAKHLHGIIVDGPGHLIYRYASKGDCSHGSLSHTQVGQSARWRNIFKNLVLIFPQNKLLSANPSGYVVILALHKPSPFASSHCSTWTLASVGSQWGENHV